MDCSAMDYLRLNYELVGDSHALRMGNVLYHRPYTKHQEGLAVSGITTRSLLNLVKESPPKKHIILVIGCNDIIRIVSTPFFKRKEEFFWRRESLLALLNLMSEYSCLVLKVFPIPRMEELYGDVARFYLSMWNKAIEHYNGFDGIKVVETHNLLCLPDKKANVTLYEKYIGPQYNADYVHLNKTGYEIILDKLASEIQFPKDTSQ